MSATRNFLALDLGASSGRVMAGIYDGRRLSFEEMARFGMDGVLLPDGWHWDVMGILADIRKGIAKAQAEFGDDVVSVSVDTWGVDYGLLDAGGRLLGMANQTLTALSTAGRRSSAGLYFPCESSRTSGRQRPRSRATVGPP